MVKCKILSFFKPFIESISKQHLFLQLKNYPLTLFKDSQTMLSPPNLSGCEPPKLLALPMTSSPFPMSETSFLSFHLFSFSSLCLSLLSPAGRRDRSELWSHHLPRIVEIKLKVACAPPVTNFLPWIRSIQKKESIHTFWFRNVKPWKRWRWGRKGLSQLHCFLKLYVVIWFSGLFKQHLQPYLGWKHDISFGNLVSDMVCILTVCFYEWHFSWLNPPREQQAQTRN